MSERGRYSLQRTMIMYLLLIGFASLLLSVEFLVETHGDTFQQQLAENLQQYRQGAIEAEAVWRPIDRLRTKALLMILIILAVMAIVLTMFIKNITEPLQHMIEVSRKISAGDMSPAVRIEAENELAQLGAVINEMASNLQEIILLSRRMCATGHRLVRKVEEAAAGNGACPPLDDLARQARAFGGELATFEEVMACFRTYSVGTD